MIVDADDGKNKEILVVTLSDIKNQILIVDADDGKNKEILVVTLSDIKYQILIVDADDGKNKEILVVTLSEQTERQHCRHHWCICHIHTTYTQHTHNIHTT